MKLKNKKFKLLFLLASILFILIILYFGRLYLNKEIPIQAKGGTLLNIKIDCPVYKQTDLRWANETIGGSNEKLSAVGCTLCCTAMAYESNNIKIKPNALNSFLKTNKGYTENGWLIWDAIEKFSNDKFKIISSNKPKHNIIDAELINGNPVITKVLISNCISHWVLITGKDGLEYLIHDPLGSETGFDLLSDYESKIYRIRYLKRE